MFVYVVMYIFTLLDIESIKHHNLYLDLMNSISIGRYRGRLGLKMLSGLHLNKWLH